MLGHFLEYSLQAPDPGASLAFYERLGFSRAQVGEAWPHAYAVVTDGRLCLGLHGEPFVSTSLTFVRPNVLGQIGRLERLGLDIEFRHLGNDVFNEVGWRDPSGHLIRLIEARTFSPVKRAPGATSLCGYFQEIALPAADARAAKEFWERLGFVGLEEAEADLPHIVCTSDSIDVGLYDPAQLRAPTLIFETAELESARLRLAALGIDSAALPPAPLAAGAACLLRAPEGTPLLLIAPR
ncbi:MAG TPA: hypothetical protein VKT22_01015 [Steroidobacteraceae bacterium]|nr:hypothetical protein [Steroidobacteraceae bacterium]